MRFELLFIACLLFPIAAQASDSLEPPPAPLTAEDLSTAMVEAQTEYESAIKAKPEQRPRADKKGLANLVAELAASQKPQERSVLENLAKEVDTLRSRLVIERATMLATQTPKSVKMRGATTIFNYRDDAVYQVTSAVDYVTDVRLKPGEKLTTPPSAGDTVRWNIGVMESGAGEKTTTHLILKPTETEIETNLVVVTDKHTYQLALKSGDVHMPSVAWNYPEDNEAQIRAALKREKNSEPTVRPEHLRFSYKIEGSDVVWRPIRVFDDGAKTFLQMPLQMRVDEAPALFVLESGEAPLLVNYRVEGDYYIVDRLFQEAELVVGTKKRISVRLDDGKTFFQRLWE